MAAMQEHETKTEIEVEIGNSVAKAVVTVLFLDEGRIESYSEVTEFEGVKRPKCQPFDNEQSKIWYALDALISGEIDFDEIEKECLLEIETELDHFST
jgi:hypothetical protein